jgi:hypothetical protein
MIKGKSSISRCEIHVLTVQTTTYGEKATLMSWEKTIACFLVSVGFVRAKNDIFFYNPENGMIILLYVDDLLMDMESLSHKT